MPEAVPIISDHVARALSHLTSQFQDKDFIRALVEAIAEEIQEAEDTAADLCLLRELRTCTGAQLDGLGEIVGELRGGRTDSDYRMGIYLKMLKNTSKGEPRRMMAALAIITAASWVNYIGVYPAAYQLETDGATAPDNLYETMETISPAGVSVVGIVYVDPDEEALVFATEAGEIPNVGLGLSNLASPVWAGGMVAELII